jgi:hypothetical protein
MSRATAAGCAVLALSCGYHAVYGGRGPERLHVRFARTLVPDAVASDEVLSGLREELLREGALEPGDGWPRAEIEVLRATESSEGIAARPRGPFARGIDVGVTGRAWIVRAPGAPPERDTGDMHAEVVISVDETAGVVDARSSWFHQSDALRAAGRRLGRTLGRKLMGIPAVGDTQDLSEDVGGGGLNR